MSIVVIVFLYTHVCICLICYRTTQYLCITNKTRFEAVTGLRHCCPDPQLVAVSLSEPVRQKEKFFTWSFEPEVLICYGDVPARRRTTCCASTTTNSAPSLFDGLWAWGTNSASTATLSFQSKSCTVSKFCRTHPIDFSCQPRVRAGEMDVKRRMDIVWTGQRGRRAQIYAAYSATREYRFAATNQSAPRDHLNFKGDALAECHVTPSATKP